MTTPTYTYSGDPATSDKDAVRFWTEDIGTGNVWYLSDQGINYVLTIFTNPLRAAANCARTIAAQFANKVNKRVGDLSINYSELQQHWTDLAAYLEQNADTLNLAPYAGGTSISDIEQVVQNTNRPRPPFRLRQFDDRSSPNGSTGPDGGWGNWPSDGS